MPLARLKGCPLHYERQGTGPAILFAAGLNGRGAYWAAQTAALAGAFTTVTFDHRSCGGSPYVAPPYDVEQWAGDATDLLDHLGLEQAVLVGHSTGGAICQAIAAAAPARTAALLLSGTWARADARFRAVFELRRRVLHRLDAGDYAVLGALLTAPIDGYAPPSPSSDPVDVTDGRLAALLAWDAGDRLRAIRAPTLVVAAADDQLIPPAMARPLLEEIRHARYRLLDGGGHHVPQTRAPAYTAALLDLCGQAGGAWADAAAQLQPTGNMG